MEISNANSRSASAYRSPQQWIQQHPLFTYFFLAYAFSWIVFIPYVLGERGILQGNYTFFYILHVFGPAIAAIVITSVIAGKAGLQELRQRIQKTHVSSKWYLFILLGIPALVMLGIIVQPGVALSSFKGFTTSMLAGYPIFLVSTFFGVGLGEEPGWRGFALPRMQKQYSALWGTLLLGVLWSCWHLPDFLTASKGGGEGTGWITFLTNFPVFTLAVVSLAVIMTWLYNNTQGSLFIAILAHASVDAPEVAGWTALFPAVSMIGLHWAILFSFGVPALLILILTRGRLGYKQGQG
ncbi:MAG: CPBP family intramembrane metalloprotease [Anaerolineales bacterium]|nr:CPBP family intramembrane metalloprotease [Anaerolineales bacterium]